MSVVCATVLAVVRDAELSADEKVKRVRAACEGETLLHIHRVDAFGEKEATTLAGALVDHPTLETLSLRECAIGNAGAVALARVLESSTKLTKLDLGCCSIGAKGTVALAEALKTNRTLETLILSSSRIKDKGAAALADMLGQNATLVLLGPEPMPPR